MISHWLTLLVLFAGLPPATAQELHVYFGNLHSHTSYSDGSGVPSMAYEHARDVAKLDFLAITEHNHARCEFGIKSGNPRRDGIMIGKNHSLYKGPQDSALIPQANHWTKDGMFVALYGQEFSAISKGNHINVFDVPEVIDVKNGEFGKLVRNWLPANKDSSGQVAVIQFNHPGLYGGSTDEYGRDDFGSDAKWLDEMDKVASLIEILNGPAMTTGAGESPAEEMEKDYLDYLNLGFHLSPTADQDNHYYTWGTATNARTGIIAPHLTRQDLLQAMRDRHTYATTDANLRVMAFVNGHLSGDRITAPDNGSELQIEISLVDDDEPDAGYEIEVFSDLIGGADVAKKVDTFKAEGNTKPGEVYSLDGVRYTGGRQYVFFKIIQYQEDGDPDIAWTAPAWFDADMPAPVPVADEGIRIVEIVPNPSGDESQKESITIKNTSDSNVDLAGWIVMDLAKRSWKLDELGTIAAGQTKTIKRKGQPMGLNNSGDVVTLMHGSTVIQTVPYGKTAEDVVVHVNP